MPATVALTRSGDGAGNVIARLGLPLADEYLDFVGGRCRPNTVLAVAYDLKVFFTVAAQLRGQPGDQHRVFLIGLAAGQVDPGDRIRHRHQGA